MGRHGLPRSPSPADSATPAPGGDVNRGDVYRLGGDRTVLIIQAVAITVAAPTVIALPVTTVAQRAGWPLTIALEPAPGLPGPAWVKATVPQTLAQSALAGPVARLDLATMGKVDQALVAVLGLEDLCGTG